MIRCQPPTNRASLEFLRHICDYEERTIKTLWHNSFKTPQLIGHEDKKILESWQPFQYWSQGNPPDDVKEITATWNAIFRSIGIKPIKTFDRISALEYISNNQPELSVPFETSFHYAVESDIFRVAYAHKNNCIWLDSDLYPKRNTENILKALIARHKTTLYFRWFRPKITNAFFITPSSSIFFANMLTSTANIDFSTLPRTAETIIQTFGPGRYNHEFENILKTGGQSNETISIEKSPVIKHFNFVNEHTFADMRPPFNLHYKSTKDSWQKLFLKTKSNQ